MVPFIAFSKTTLTMFPLALGLEELVAPFMTTDRMVEIASAIIKLILTMAAYCVAIFVPSFSFLCALVGMICTMTVSIVFPAAAHIRMFGSQLSWMEIILDALLVVVGTVMAVLGTIATVAGH
jgi:solute carrier family 32 (vesicular inhibitory amino acid transporter)